MSCCCDGKTKSLTGEMKIGVFTVKIGGFGGVVWGFGGVRFLGGLRKAVGYRFGGSGLAVAPRQWKGF